MTKRALIIEDDSDVCEIIVEQLSAVDFRCDTAGNGVLGLEMAQSNEYDLVMLDLNLPRLEGAEVCKRLRQQKKTLPIIIFSSQSDEMNKVLLLELGADDYITKNVNPMELKARIKAVMRRWEVSPAAVETASEFEYRGLRIDFVKRRVWLQSELVELTAREFDLLSKLASQPGRPFNRTELTETLYGIPEITGHNNSVSSYVNRLRAKIEPDVTTPIYILTVRGIGYCFADSDQSGTEQSE